mgnify:CR=1 FL=1
MEDKIAWWPNFQRWEKVVTATQVNTASATKEERGNVAGCYSLEAIDMLSHAIHSECCIVFPALRLKQGIIVSCCVTCEPHVWTLLRQTVSSYYSSAGL